jgi:hypothetical protein
MNDPDKGSVRHLLRPPARSRHFAKYIIACKFHAAQLTRYSIASSLVANVGICRAEKLRMES